MRITEAKFENAKDATSSLIGFASIVISGEMNGETVSFTVKDIKIIRAQRADGGPFLVMPFRLQTSKCSNCHAKMPVEFQYCGECSFRMPKCDVDLLKSKIDVFHPINAVSRLALTKAILEKYEEWKLNNGKQLARVL